jgi:aryl-alcohol dehydrogenase-like predicted oxidoreductase
VSEPHRLDVPRVVLGCGNFGGVGSAPAFFGQGTSETEAFALMDAAWELGVRRFDTADAYGGGRSERYIGSWIESTGCRPRLTTKTFNAVAEGADHGLARDRVLRQIEASLERLGVDSIELYLMHEAPDVQVEEAVDTFEEVVASGRAQAWGVSNVDRGQLRLVLAAGRPAYVQNSYSLLDHSDEDDVLPLCADHGIAYQAFGPLAGGWLTGKYRHGAGYPPGSRMTQRPEGYRRYESERVFRGLDALRAEAGARGVGMAGVALAWLLSNPDVESIVVGPGRPEHLAPVTEASGVSLSPAERDELRSLFP